MVFRLTEVNGLAAHNALFHAPFSENGVIRGFSRDCSTDRSFGGLTSVGALFKVVLLIAQWELGRGRILVSQVA